MKRLIPWILILVMALPLFACHTQTPPPVDPVRFYYPRKDLSYDGSDGVIAWEVREADGLRETPGELLNQYLNGPEDPALVSPFPAGTSLEKYRRTGATAYLTLSSDLAALSGMPLTVACASLTMTVFAITDCETAYISASGAPLDGKKWLVFKEEDLLLADDSVERLRDSMSLYLLDKQENCLIAAPVTVNLTSGSSACMELMELLIQGLPGSGLLSPLPEGTKLLGASVNEGLCTVNLSREFEGKLPQEPAKQHLVLQSIANTLTQLNYVDSVVFYCEGVRLLHYGMLDTGEPWCWSSQSLAPDSETQDTFSGNLYVRTVSSDGLVPIPVRLSGSTRSPQEQLLNALFQFASQNGYTSPIPPETQLLSVELRQGLCLVDLSGEFLSQPQEQLTSAVHAVVATACTLPEVDCVRIVIDGATPEGDYGDLFTALAPDAQWLA